MKKLLIIMTLFMSSFFLFCNKEVKAYEIIRAIDFSYLDDNFYTYKDTVEKYIESDTTLSDKFIICRVGSSLTLVSVILPLDYSFSPYVGDTGKIYLNTSTLKGYKPSSPYTSLGSSYNVAYVHSGLYSTTSSSNNFIPLYSNFDIIMKEDSSKSTITYTYDDFSAVDVADGVDTLNTLYDNYVLYQEYLGNKELVHKEELEKVGSFYNIVIEKLGYLAETIVSNYIYLSIIVIFILIFVFLLIFRRFL